MSILRITVLGDFSVQSADASLPLPPSRKTKALLAYLAVVRRPQRRERLCEMFWDIPDDPRGSLRWSLSRLRSALGRDAEAVLRADRATVSVNPEAIDLDFDVLRGVAPDALAELPLPELEAIAGAFDGPFLADLSLPRCPEFEAWRTSYANETELLRLQALRTLIQRLGDQPQRALGHAQMLQTLCPEEDLGDEIARLVEQVRNAATRPTEDLQATDSLPAAERRQVVRFCRSADGVRIAYAVSGTGPAVVRTGHWMSHLEYDWESPVWGHWIQALSQDFQFIRYDERLNGLSDQSAANLDMAAMVADLHSVVQAADVDRFVLLGVSQGCAVSIRYAVEHPERVVGLVLYGGYLRGWRARGDASEVARREAMAILMREGWGRDDPTFRQLFTSLFIPGANREQMDWYNELQKRTITADSAYRLSHAFADVDVSDLVARIRVPTLVLHGNDDRIVPLSNGVHIAESIADARFVELDSANHILLADEPAFQRFVSETSAFVRQVWQRSTTPPISSRRWRSATVLCAEFVSPVQALADLAPEAAFEVVDPVVMQTAEHARARGGTVVDLLDSRITVSFSDAADGNHAALACRVALELRDLVAGLPGALIRVRIALDTGQVMIAPARMVEEGLEARGTPVTVAQMLNGALRRDLLAATARTRDAAGPQLQFAPLPAQALSAFPRGQALYELGG